MELVNGEYIKIIKPYSCNFKHCDKKFVKSTELSKHLKKHRLEREYYKNNY